MERRKFVVGLGALATGTAAATGTGAFSQASASRGVSVSVVSDNSAFATLLADDSGLENSEYAEQQNGKLELRFNESADVNSGGFLSDGTGLSTDSEYFFDNVFGYGSRTGDSVTAEIDWSGLDNPEHFVFYDIPQQGRPTEVNPDGDYTEGFPGTGSGSYVGVGVGIDTTGADLGSEWETGTIEITFEN